MPVCTLIRPLRLNRNRADGFHEQYGVGQYWFEGLDAYNGYVMHHCRNGRPENDAVRITDPGSPVTIGLPPAPTWRPPW